MPKHAGADGECPDYGSRYDPCAPGCASGTCVYAGPVTGAVTEDGDKLTAVPTTREGEMKNVIGDTAQELADYLDDLMRTGSGVTEYDDPSGAEYPVTEVGDADMDKGLGTVFKPSASFIAVVGGQRVRVTVAAA